MNKLILYIEICEVLQSSKVIVAIFMADVDHFIICYNKNRAITSIGTLGLHDYLVCNASCQNARNTAS